ncbi:cobalamin biosynthesis protein CbiG [Methylobacterium currus]|uniref:Cobalamin biosynthesis protein CbiG n=1 Tax=Methylobacterium currus TaxID=2051553 RepID=A0A2R4WHV4_9HYPH|nr:cobalamin biosynthesis protein [Methylobacterium currus]AWB21128.1 cobalamin biosynthesis protein CbiG [Methylobacterium currus]UHC14031.1 cobalamin biosynthesis protein [Methylobacterium currus]
MRAIIQARVPGSAPPPVLQHGFARAPGVETPRALVAGIGFRHATSADEILALVAEGLRQADRPGAQLAALATAEDRAGDRAIRDAAGSLGVPLVAIGVEALREAGRRVVTRSVRIEALRGVGSLAEAAALAAAGPDGRLVLPRIASAGATCALAASGEAYPS